MKEIKIRTQKELDALTRVEKDESVEIVGEGLKLNANIEVFGFLKILVKVEMSWSTFYVEARESSSVEARGSSSVEARESSSVEARGSSSVVAWESSRVEAWESSRVVARESSSVEARGSSSVEAWGSSRVVAWESSRVEAWGSSRVVAWGSSRVEAWGSSSVVARESSSVVAWGSSRVEAWGSSSVVAWESSSVEARESSRVEAWGSSRVEAWGSSVSWVYSTLVKIKLFGWSVSYKMFIGKGNITKERDTATIIEVPEQQETFEDYSDRYGVLAEGDVVKMYKAVHKDEKGFFSDYEKSFRYEIGKECKEKCAVAGDGACAQGLHVAHKSWARMFGASWQDFALIECEIEIKDIVVSKDTDGKVRCSKLKVLREVPSEEYYN